MAALSDLKLRPVYCGALPTLDSQNGGNSWDTRTDAFSSLFVTALAAHDTDPRIFAATPGEPVGRTKLVEDLGRAGGKDGDAAQERAIDVQITRLRKKVEDTPRSPRFIKTVRGAGYMLAPDGAGD